jgi:signal transduction histidine kinase
MDQIVSAPIRRSTPGGAAPHIMPLLRPSRPRAWLASAMAFATSAHAAPESAVDERVLAATRCGAALVLLVATFADSHARHNTILLGLIAIYGAHAASVLIHNLVRPEGFVKRANLLQWIDLTWTVVATSVSGGASSFVFPFFTFVLAAAAVRWGLRRSLQDGAIVLLVAVIQAAVLMASGGRVDFEWDYFLVRVSFVVFGVGVLFGNLAEQLHALRFQATALTDLVNEIGRTARLQPALELMLRRVLEIFQARQAWLIVEEIDAGQVHVWRAETTGESAVRVSRREERRELHERWFAPSLGLATACEFRRSGSTWHAMSLAAMPAGRLVPVRCSLPRDVIESEPGRTIVAAPVEFTRVFRGHIYVCDPLVLPRGAFRLRFLRRLSLQAPPALLNLYLLRNLRSRAESVERARIAHELHDGVLQSLAGIEMRLDVLRRGAETSRPEIANELADVRDLLHEQALETRELMLRLRPLDVATDRLQAALRDVLERFSRTVDVKARLEWAVDRLPLSPRECNEVVRILQEALVNVRRHSHATEVGVRVEADADGWAIIVTDNGDGFGFTGRKTHDRLEAENTGPRVIRERVATLGGTIAVESSPGGACLDMRFPIRQAG